MAKSFKRLMSLALVLAMLFTMLPATLAEETASAEVPAVEEIVEVIEETPAEEESAEEEAPVEETTEEETPVEETPVEETTEEETPVEETTEEETTEEETPVEETTEEETTEEETPVEETTEEETTEEETTEEETTEEETTEEETTEEETTEEETTEEETAEEETSEEEEPIYEEDPAAMLGVAVSEGGTVVLEQKDSFVVTGNDILSDQIDAPRWYPVTYYVQYRIKGETSAFIKKKLDDSITLEHGTTYEVQEGYLGAGEKWSDSYYIDFNVYHEVTASLADASDTNATGASVSIDRTKVYHGESVTVTAVRVEGYKAVLMFNDVEIHTFNSDDTEWSIAHKVTASGTYTVQYVSIEEKQYAVNLSVENSDYGSASLGKTEGSEGDEILLTVTVNDTGADNSKYVYKVEVSGESAFYDSETSKVKIGTEDVVVTVSFSKKELKGNASASVNFNGFYADATALGSNDLAALKEDIFNAIVTNDADEVEVGNVEIQYYPFYENKFLGSVTESGYSDAEKLKALNATTDDSLLAGTGIEYYAFGERGIGAKEKVRITWDGLFIDAYVTLVESRDPHPYTTGTPETVTLTGNTETDKDAIVASAEKSISGTVEGAIISYTVGDYTVPAAGENGEATVNVVIQENENYLESAFEISVPITTEVSPAVITVTQNNNGVVEVPETAYASNGAVTVKVTPNSGYYVESVTVNDTSVTGTYSRVDVDESYIDNDYRNIFTGSFEIVDGETYEVEVTYGKITVSVSELTISVNGFSDETAQADFSEKLAVSAIGAAATDANGNNVAGELKVQLNGALDWKDADSLKGLLSNYLDVPANRDMRVVFTPEDTNKYPEVVSETVKLTIVESRPQTKISVKEEVTLKVEDASQITWDAVFEEMGGVEAYTLNADDKKDQPIDWSNVTYAPAELNTTCPENGKSVEYTHKFELAETAEYLGTSAEAVITIANPEYYANLTVEPGNSTVTIYNEAGETVNEFTQMAGGTYTAEVAVTEGEYSLVSVKFNDVDLNAINGVYEFALESGETAVNEYKLIVTTEPVNYNVTWIVDGSSYDTGSVGFGTEITPPATPTKDGYTFGGWDKEIPETMPAENITFTAKDWVANTDTAYTVEIYTMDVYGNYGEAVKENLTGTTDTEAVYIPAQKEGFTVADKISGNIAGDGSLVLKVYYSRNQWTVTWNINGKEYKSEVLYYGAEITAPEYTEKEGYTFTAWADVAATMPDNDVTYNATETVNEYTVTWNAGSGVFANGSNSIEQTYAYGAEIKEPEDPTCTGYNFNGWDKNVVGVMGAENVVYNAQWGVNTYIITYKDGNNTLATASYEYGAPVPSYDFDPETEGIQNPAKTGYTFNGWNQKIPATMPAENITVTAAWFANTNTAYTVEIYTMDVNGQYGKAVKEKLTGTTDTEAVYIPAQKEGFTVADKISGNIAGDGSLVLKVYYSRNQWTVTWNINGEKYESEDLYYGAKITAPEYTEKEGYTFTAWANVAETMPDHDLAYDAAETRNSYKLTFVVDDASTEQLVLYGDPVTAPAAPEKEGYVFVGWNDGENTYVPVNGAVTLPNMGAADVTYTAEWSLEKYKITFNSNGGSDVQPITAEYKSLVYAPEAPVMNDFVFDCWIDADGSKVEWPVEMPLNGAEFTAVWLADANNNGVNDELEIVAVKVIGNGSVTVDGESVTEILYDSTADVFVTIAATPVIENAVSKSYVSAIMLDQENAEFTYMADFSAEATLKVNGADEITAVFADCAFVYDEDGMLSYYVGIDTPEAKELYEAVIVDPAYSEYVKSVQYLARPADKYSVTIPVLLDIDVFGRNIKIGGNTVEVDLDDAWLNVGDTFKVLTEEELQKMIDDEVAAIKDKISKINYKDITFQNFGTVLAQLSEISNDLEDLVAVITNEAKYLGYHAFGSVENAKTDENGNVQEILKVEYVDAAKRLFDDAIVITLVDDRIETAIIGGDVEFEYDEYDNDDILAALTLTAEGEGAIEGECKILTDLSGKDVGEYTYHVYYDGSSEYKPAAAEFTLTVVKAPASIDVPNVSAVYGSSYSAKPVITNKHDETINANLIEVFVGVDVSELDVNADGVHNVSGKIQLIPSNDIRTVLALIGLEEGKTYSVSEIASILNNASDVLGTFGVNSDIAGVINNAVNELSSVLSGVDADITIGGSYPTNIGVYLHGAVISDSNYKTAFDIGYLLIAPETTEHELTWYVNDENFVVTLPLAQDGEYLKALADGEDNSSIEYLYLGVNGKNDIEFVHTSAAEINECGAYIQIAYLLNWGNEVAYAKPILRPVVVVPEVYTITFVDENGNENNDRVFEFDNTEKAMKAVVTDEYGNEVSDADLTVTYIGIQTNGKTYNSTTAPKHAGVYSVFATIFECDEDGVPTAAGMAAGAMAIVPTTANVNVDNDYKLYDGENVFSYMDLDDADTVKLISASSKVEGLTPDITIISAALVSEIGAEYAQDWQFADVSVNIDLPAWLDSYLPENMKDGADWAAVQNWLNGLVAANEELSAFISEYELTSYVETLTETLAQFYDLSDITFYDFDEVIENENPNVANPAVAPSKVGAYLIAAVVTDSDHIPAADTGVLVITPALADVYFVDENGNKNNDRIFTYDGNAKEMKAVVEVNGEIVENAQIVPYYAGVESVIDTPLYHSVSAPSETGAYAVIAVYVGQDEQGRITAIGACVGAMAIEPAEAEIAVEGVVANEAVIVNDLVSTKPETGVTTTVITTGLKLDYELVAAAANGDVTGIADIYSYVDYINIDLPAYIDEALKLAEFDGDVTVGTLIAKLNELKSTYADVKAAARKLAGEYAELKALAGAIVELTGLDIDTVIEQLKIADDGIEMAVDQLIAALDLYEDTLIVTTIDNYAVSETGVYNVTAIVTDSDYLPAAASDFVVIVPVFAEVLVDDKLYTFDGEEKNAVVIVKENGEVIAEPDHLIVTYTGVQTDGKIYETTTAAPKYAGVYAVAALYYRGENQTLEAFGAGAGVIVIKPAMLTVEIPEDKNTFDYDGEEHAPTAVITTEGEGRYKTVITAVKVNDTTVNVIMDEAVIELIKSVIAAMDETYDAAKELPADVKALIKGVAKLAGFEANDLEQLKALVKASIDGTIEVENYVAAIAKVEKLLTAARDNAKELVDTYGAKAAAELSELIGADAAEIAKAYAEKAVDLLAAYSQKAIDAVADIKAYVQSTGITSVTINGANPVEVGVYPVIALGYLNSDHMIGIVKGKMEIVETRWHIDKDRMQLQNSLNMQFAFSTEHEENWDGYYAQIVAHHEENTVTKTIPASEWKSVTISGVKYHMITFADLAAKQMADLIEITVYDANGDAASFTWENSIRDHAMRNYKQYGDESKRLMVDMLNYGAAAQKHFDYNTDDLANNLLTEEHLAYATPSVTVENKIEVTGSDYYGTNFDLESRISMQYAFENITDDMYAVVTFKNHHNSEKNLTINAADMEKRGEFSIVRIEEVVLADGRQPVTCTIYQGETVVAQVTDSLESYVARNNELEIAVALMKVSDAAYAYFH